jgi:hypothetical protein
LKSGRANQLKKHPLKIERESKSTIENSRSNNESESAIDRAQENVVRRPENEDDYNTENKDDKILTEKIITGDAKMPARRKTDEEPEEMEMDANKPSYEELFPEQEGPHEERPGGGATELGFNDFYLGMKAYSWERIPDVENDLPPRIYATWQDSPYYGDPIDKLPEPWAEARRVA